MLKGQKLNLPSSKGEQQARRDHRTQRDCTLHCTEAFDHQMDGMVMGYLRWCHRKSQHQAGVNFFSKRPVGEDSEKVKGKGHWIGIVVDVFHE